MACFLSGLNENAVDSNGNPIPNGTPCGVTANTYFQSNPTMAQQAIIDPTKINPIATEYINLGLLPTNPNGVANYQGAHTDNNNELTVKFDFSITDKDKLSATIGGFRNPQLNPFQFATRAGRAQHHAEQ